jgi:hypothetical protein
MAAILPPSHDDMTPAPRVRPSRAEYQKARRALLHDLYFKSVEEKADLKAMAEAEGYAKDFNGWLIIKIHASLSGSIFPAEYVEGLKTQLERVTKWHEAAREEANAYRSEVATLRQQKDTLLLLLHELPEGAEVAARWMQRQAQAQGVR